MGFLHSVKSRFNKDSEEEEDFERAFREGRFPEGVDDFEPLSTTGSFVAAGLEPESQPQGFGSHAGDDVADPFAEPAPADGYSAGTPRPSFDDADVQVFDRTGEVSTRPVTAAVKPEPFAARLRARVAAANVSGQEDETLGRSKAATGAQPPVRAVAPRPARRSDVPEDELEAELAERRRARQEREQAAVSARAPQPRRATEEDDGPDRGGADDARPSAAPEASLSSSLKPLALPTPAVLLRPRLYDDVAEVAEGVVAKHQPVILILRGSSSEVARRTLDFSFGLCCGTQAEMRQLDERVYAVIPRGTDLADADLIALRHQGVLTRG